MIEATGTASIAALNPYLSEIAPTTIGPVELPSRFCTITQTAYEIAQSPGCTTSWVTADAPERYSRVHIAAIIITMYCAVPEKTPNASSQTPALRIEDSPAKSGRAG